MGKTKVQISKRRAKELGIADDRRLNLTRQEFEAAVAKKPSEKKEPSQAAKEFAAFSPEEQAKRTQVSGEKAKEVQPRPTIKLEQEDKSLRQLSLEKHPKLTKGLEVSAGVLGVAAAGLGIAAWMGTGTAVATAAQVSKGAVPIAKAFQRNPKTGGIIAKYATNSKSLGLTTSLLKKTFKLAKNPGVLIGAIGSYPFAGFIKEEALQTLSFGVRTAQENNDAEGMQIALEEQAALLDPTAWQTIFNSIPYANVLTQLKSFYKAALTKLEIDAKALDTLRGQLAGEPSEYEKSQADARQTQLEQRQRDAEYYQLIRDGKFEEADELLQSELKQ